MDTQDISSAAQKTVFQSAHFAKTTLWLLFKEKQIWAYIPASVFFISATSVVITSLIYKATDPVQRVVAQTIGEPTYTYKTFGLIAASLSTIYVIIVTTVFVCATSDAVLNRLSGVKSHFLSGIIHAFNKLPRIIRFSVASPILPILALVTFRKKIKTLQFYEAFGSALTINNSALAPEIMTGKMGIRKSIESTNNKVGSAWKEGLIFKAWLYGLTVLLASLAFVPIRAKHVWFGNPELSRAIAFLIGVAYAQLLFVTNRIISTVYSAVVYSHFNNK